MATAVRLQTDRLVLRPRHESDIDALVQLERDPEVYCFSEVRGDATARPPARAALRRVLQAQIAAEAERSVWAIQSRGKADVLGLVALDTQAPAILGFPGAPDMLFLTYRLARDAWGQGLATEAAAAVVAHGFAALGARAIVAFSHAANSRSRRVLEKLAMTATGMLLARAPDAGAGQLYICFRRERGAMSPPVVARRAGG